MGKLPPTWKLVYYVIHLVVLYLWLIPSIASSISYKCSLDKGCRRYIYLTIFGYTIDAADSQWKGIRSNMYLLWMAMIGVSVCHFIVRYFSRTYKSSKRNVENRVEKSNKSYPNDKDRRQDTVNDESTYGIGAGLFAGAIIGLLVNATLGVCIGITTAAAVVSTRRYKDYKVPSSSYFRCIVGLGFVYFLHGNQMWIILVISSIGLYLPTICRESNTSVTVTWIFAFLVLLFKECDRIKDMPMFSFLRWYFDDRHGIYRWKLPANFLVLRIVSFSLDYHWACKYWHEKEIRRQLREEMKSNLLKKSSSQEQRNNDKILDSQYFESDSSKERETNNSSKERETNSDNECIITPKSKSSIPSKSSTLSPIVVSADKSSGSLVKSKNKNDNHRKLSEYTFWNYMSYILYPPLYVAGPIMSFNDFMENTTHPQSSENPWIYGARWLGTFMLMEFMTNKFPFFAVIHSGLFPKLSVDELAVLAYMTLKMMWLKFLLIWRFFRLWAMADGTLAPENMIKCMSNNYSLKDFWKGWHASFNKWIIRYMYKPMGGISNSILNVCYIFLFVAIWHDIELKLIMWALLNSFFYLVEFYTIEFFKTHQEYIIGSYFLNRSAFYAMCSFGGALYIVVLIAVNLLGYAVGVGGLWTIIQRVQSWEGFIVLLVSLHFLTVGVQIMQDIDVWRKGGKPHEAKE